MIGAESVQRYLTVADECAKAGLMRLHRFQGREPDSESGFGKCGTTSNTRI